MLVNCECYFCTGILNRAIRLDDSISLGGRDVEGYGDEGPQLNQARGKEEGEARGDGK